jgi:hypothetical protein
MNIFKKIGWSMLFLSVSCFSAIAQGRPIKELLSGAWTFESVMAESADGTKSVPFGANPKGIIIFTLDGHFSLFQSRAEVPKIASNDRTKATPEEAAGVLAASIAYFGTYSINEPEKSLMLKINGSTFANLLGGPAQRRNITSITQDELKFTNPRTPSGVTLHTVWRRAKAP